MQTVRMVSIAAHVYASRSIKVGEQFDCEPQHVDLMKMLGRARLVESSYQTRDMTVETPRRRLRK